MKRRLTNCYKNNNFREKSLLIAAPQIADSKEKVAVELDLTFQKLPAQGINACFPWFPSGGDYMNICHTRDKIESHSSVWISRHNLILVPDVNNCEYCYSVFVYNQFCTLGFSLTWQCLHINSSRSLLFSPTSQFNTNRETSVVTYI